MKKLLLLFLIAPIIGNSQLLDLPVKKVIMINNITDLYTIQSGEVAQLLSSSYKNVQLNSENFKVTVTPRLDPCIKLKLPNGLSFNDSTVYGNTVLREPFTISLSDEGGCFDAFYTFVIFDLNAQNLASNVPKQTTPTLYPNPTSSLLALNSDEEYDIEVYDMAGNKVMALTGNTIDMSHLSSATYIVKALDKVENEELSYKVVKN